MAERGSIVERWVPGVRMARTYQRSWLRSDVVAGLVLAAILVPQGMAYAELAGLPPVTGLYTTVACLIAYSFFGPSRVLVLGPDSSVSPLILAAITPLFVAGDMGEAIALAGMLAVLVGLIEIALGVWKLGFVADLLSSEVQVGYMNGLAVTIIVGQLPKLFGFSTDADSFVDEVREFARNLDETVGAALIVGLAVLAVLIVLPRISRRIPAVLVAVVGATIASAIFDLASEGVKTVGTLPEGFPRPSLPWTEVDDVLPLLIAAIGITLVSLADTIATASSFAARRGDEVDPDQEMVAIGSANVAAGFFQGFAISTSGSRTAVAEQSGAKSQVAGIVGASVVVLLLVFLSGLLADLPQSALGAIVIMAALSLVNVKALLHYRRVRRSALILSLVTSGGVIFLGVLEGIVIAIALAIVMFFRRSWWPYGAVVGRIDGMGGWHSVEDHPEAREVPGVVIYRWEAPLFFANANSFRRQIRHLVKQRQPRWVVLQCEAITDIDVTAGEVLRDLDDELNAMGIHMAFAEMRSRLQALARRYGLLESLDRDHFYPSVQSALDAIAAEEPPSQTSAVETTDGSELLDERAVLAIRRVALGQAARVEQAWRELAAADPNDRSADGEAAEALHDFRVALRTLRSWVRGHKDALRVPKKIRRQLQRAAHATNGSRDAEVLAALLAHLQGLTRTGTASARWWQQQLEHRAADPNVIERLQHDIEAGLCGLEQHLAVVHWEQPVDEPWDFPSFAEDLADRVRRHRDELDAAFAAIEYSEREETVHLARIAAKRVRYLLEPVKRGVPEAATAVKTLKKLQDDFGELHDLHVARTELDAGVSDRAKYEADERTREILDAATEARSPRRFASRLGGFASIASALRDEEHAQFKTIENRWLDDRAAVLFQAIDDVIAALNRRAGAGIEIERKYLLACEPEIPADAIRDVIEMEQGYVPGEHITERLRRERHADGTVALVRTVKAGTGLVRVELEDEVDPEMFDAWWPSTAARRVRKRRTKAEYRGQIFEVDVFLDRELVLAEIELERADDHIELPPWLEDVLVADVTDDGSYSNAKLARPAT